MDSTLKRLQRWYEEQTDGDWEHQYGVIIETLDNPGWSLRIDLMDTSLHGRAFKDVVVERTDSDWIHARIQGAVFEAHGGPANLEELVLLFLDWADEK